MSASLVGSEMCIRDRPPPAGRPLGLPCGLRWRAPALLPAPFGHGQPFSCLLYTSDAADDM
eukprot:3867446-Alexandrium_andersonii.AAC.1